jgi:hypothetical protein
MQWQTPLARHGVHDRRVRRDDDPQRAQQCLCGSRDWQLSGTSLWFFQNTLYPKPQQWVIRWKLPNGQGCEARFTVT